MPPSASIPRNMQNLNFFFLTSDRAPGGSADSHHSSSQQSCSFDRWILRSVSGRSGFQDLRQETFQRPPDWAQMSIRPHQEGTFLLITHFCPCRACNLFCHACYQFHSSPLAYSLERVMAAFKTQSNLLFAEIEEKNRVQCVQIEQKKESRVADQWDKEDASVDRSGFR